MQSIKNKHEYNTSAYWVDNDIQQGGHGYKSELVFNGLSKRLEIPSDGCCMQLGVHTGVTLQLMKEHFGSSRVCGLDIHNFTNDPCVMVCDIHDMTVAIPLAYAENDIGDAKIAPHDRLAAMKWAIKNLVPGGVLITTSEVANDMFGENVLDIVTDHNCTHERLDSYNHELWAQQLNANTVWNTISMMLVRKNR